MNKYFLCFTIPAICLITGCDSPEVKAKNHGFDSIEMMQEYNNRGYKTMAEYKKALDFTAENFSTQCYSKPEREYNETCKGKKYPGKE